jgi:hypothetical protein
VEVISGARPIINNAEFQSTRVFVMAAERGKIHKTMPQATALE